MFLPILLFIFLLRPTVSQLDLCEPAVSPSPSCLCTRLDFMDTYSYRLRFGNSTFAGSNYQVSPPTVNSNYNCVNEEPLQCSPGNSAFAVFNMKYVLELQGRIPSVFCYPNIRMFDMDNLLVKQFQMSGDLPNDELDLHLTEVGCIEYGVNFTAATSKRPDATTEAYQKSTTVIKTTVKPTSPTVPNGEPFHSSSNLTPRSECACTLPPAVMTQSNFNYRYAWQFPKTIYRITTPEFVYTKGCQSVSMICKYPVSRILLNEKQSQKSMMFFDEQYVSSE